MEVVLGLFSLALTIYLLITKSAFFRGRQSVRQEIDDKNADVILTLDKDVTALKNDVSYIKQSHRTLRETVDDMEKKGLLQEAKLIQLEKVFDRIITQNTAIQENLVENSKAILTLNASVEGIHSLLDNLIKGNLIIKKKDG